MGQSLDQFRSTIEDHLRAQLVSDITKRKNALTMIQQSPSMLREIGISQLSIAQYEKELIKQAELGIREQLKWILEWLTEVDNHHFGGSSSAKFDASDNSSKISISNIGYIGGSIYLGVHSSVEIDQSNRVKIEQNDARQIYELMRQLETDLRNAVERNPASAQDAEAVALLANHHTALLSEGNKKAIQISGEGLLKAATDISKIASPVLATATLVIEFINKIVAR